MSHDSDVVLAMTLPCVYCGAQPGEKCRTSGGTPLGNENHKRVHRKRRRAAQAKRARDLH